MAVDKSVSYRVVRGEKVGIGPHTIVLTPGEIVDNLPEEVLQALIDGQFVVEESADPQPDVYSQEYRDSRDTEADHAEFVQTVADEAATAISDHAPTDEDVKVDVTEQPSA